MRINGPYGLDPIPGKRKKVANAYGASSAPSGKDSFALSPFGKELSIAKQAVSQTPDVRQAKVDEIKKQMEAGTYNISASQVADKILKNFQSE